MSTHKPKLIEELAQEGPKEQIQEIKVTLEEKPDREDVEQLDE